MDIESNMNHSSNLGKDEKGPSIEKQERDIVIHIEDLKKLYDVKISLDGSLVQNSNAEGGDSEKLRRVEELLEELEAELTNGIGFETAINNAEKRFKESGTNIYFTKPEDFQNHETEN